MLFKVAGHVLLFNDTAIATFYDPAVALSTAESLNTSSPYTETLRNLLWDATCTDQNTDDEGGELSSDSETLHPRSSGYPWDCEVLNRDVAGGHDI